MDILKQFASVKIRNIKSIQEKNGDPTEAQLSSYVSTLCQQLFMDVVLRASDDVKQMCHANVVKIGWDYENKCRIPNENFSVDSVIFGLSAILLEADALIPSVEPSSEELHSVSEAAKKLWELDVNRLIPGTDYVINLQHGKRVYDAGDAAREPFYTFVDMKALEKPTFKAFVALLDNYTAETGVAEVVTNEEKKENLHFLNTIMNTPVMQYCHNYLVAHNKAPQAKDAFIRLLSELWFGLYRREAANDSSGFEHVFLGEIKDGAVTGMHNWIQLFLEEKRNNFNYLGFITPRRTPGANSYQLPNEDQQLVTIQFEWKGCLKNVSSSFIG
jgi:poly(U)-specific endoribonuclease